MIDFIPYFAGLVSILFGIAFAYAIITDRNKGK
jgi:hypothetical protein